MGLGGDLFSYSIFNDLKKQRVATLTNSFKKANTEIRKSVVENRELGSLIPGSFIRVLLFHAMAISYDRHEEGKKFSNPNTGSWSGLAAQINDFVEELPDKLKKVSCQSYDAESIKRFCTFASRKSGFNTPYYYSTLVLYLASLDASNLLDSPLLDMALLADDRAMPAHGLTYLEKLVLQEHIGKPVNETEINETLVRFNIKKDLLESFDTYCSHFLFGAEEPEMARMVLYRPTLSTPGEVMKSFLAFMPPTKETGKKSHMYTHFYEPPNKDLDTPRISTGKIIPLDGGVYLVGGQKIRSEVPDDSPFQSIKIIAFDWTGINKCNPLMQCLVFSTNYKGKIIASRAAARITAVEHSKYLSLGLKDIATLEQDLSDDFEAERTFLNKFSKNSKTLIDNRFKFLNLKDEGIAGMASNIRTLANNNPRTEANWDAPDGFYENKSSQNALTKHVLGGLVENAVSGKQGYVDSENSKFDLWKHTRFSPIDLG